MGRPPNPEPMTRKNATLPDRAWERIDALRRVSRGKVVSEQEVLRRVVSAGLDVLEKEQGSG